MARKNIPQIDALVQRTFAQKMWDNGFHPYKDHTEWLRHHPRGRMGRLYAVQPRRVQAAAHGLHLSEPAGVHPSLFEQLRHRLPGDVFLQNALLRDVRRQKPGHGDAQLPQRFIVPQERSLSPKV